jgi:hypothetical protein
VSLAAEYTMLACAYFNKDVPRLVGQKNRKEWNRFFVGELRGKTMFVCFGAFVCHLLVSSGELS